MNPPPDDIPATVKALGRLTVPELKQRYAEVFGEPTRTNHKQHLIKRIVWRMQALREFLSDPASRRGRLVYRRPVLPLAAGWPESPQNPGGLATLVPRPPRSRFECTSEAADQREGNQPPRMSRASAERALAKRDSRATPPSTVGGTIS